MSAATPVVPVTKATATAKRPDASGSTDASGSRRPAASGLGRSPERSPQFHRAARGVLRWTLTYTRGLDARVAADRQDEIASDLHEHAVWAAEEGLSPAALARQVRRRRLLGMPADLAWRHRQVRQSEPDRRFALRTNGALLSAVLAVGVVLAGSGVFLVFRIVRALAIGDIGYVPSDVVTVIGLAAVAALATLLVLRRRSRAFGALVLAVPAALLPSAVGQALYWISALMVVVVNRVPWWEPAAYVLGGGLAVLCVTAAVNWWWSSRPRRPEASVTV
ncbi:hypothetical protein [Agromyces larvae]|uniref:Uncharacterized protein n=1 Tax=Agromyces larvae TaxID=2929802 RepID=A0ABY4BVF9_9MICO|nr:hypothetical protein [Agromyces larvae]UOE42734.1 hypothetical protein MTO99_11080 [Agromyces larvae]